MLILRHFIYDLLVEKGFFDDSAKLLNMLGLLIALLIVAFIVDFISKRLLQKFSSSIANSTKTNFDDILVKNKLPRNIAHIIPLIILIEFVPQVFADYEYAENIIEKTLKVIAIVLTLQIIRSLLNSVKDYLKTLARYKDKPIDSYIQVFMIFAWLLGIFSIFAIVTGVSFMKFAATLGAASAVILLIFKDTILGFVASIQVSINDMVRIGDWITFEKFGADGDVIEINLATVKVQNFDNTITTIPTYALISDSFKNWRGMTNSDGRRIKRHMLIKQTSIKYLNNEDIERLKQIEIISTYLSTMQDKINNFNTSHGIDKSSLINGRNMTNIGVFRKFIQTYLEQHSAINNNMLLMARQLQPTSQGVPLEIYCFSKDKRWESYEYVMSDLFDHFLAAVPYFDLELFELPSNSTFK